MSITYNWTISALDCDPNVAGEPDYVVCAHWRCDGTDGTFSGSVYNTQSFSVTVDDPNYVPYAQLTEELVVSWVQTAMGEDLVNATYASIDTQIANQVNPPIISPPLPWAPVNP